MFVKLGFCMVLLVLFSVALADKGVSENLAKEKDSDIDTSVDNVLFLGGCYCGSFGTCTLSEKGEKTCHCYKGYVEKDGTCEKCDCGHGNCTLIGWSQKSCQCEEGYFEYDGTCYDCNCGPHGSCTLMKYGWKTCKCDEGYKDKQGTCEECNCGENGTCKFEYSNKVCSCIDGFVDYKGTCRECQCGNFTKPCWLYTEDRPICNCIDSYRPDKSGVCWKCDCRLENSTCSMDSGHKECNCPKGYESEKNVEDPGCTDTNECLRAEDNGCPFSTKCVNTWGSYECVCRNGFEVFNQFGKNDIKGDGCKDIDECSVRSACYNNHTLCVNTPGSYRCDCEEGYSVKKHSYSEEFNTCEKDAGSSKTVPIVVGILCGFVIIGLLIALFMQHKTITNSRRLP